MTTTITISAPLPVLGLTIALTAVVAWMLIRITRWLWNLAGLFPIGGSARRERPTRPIPQVLPDRRESPERTQPRGWHPTVTKHPGYYNAVTGRYETGGKHRKATPTNGQGNRNESPNSTRALSVRVPFGRSRVQAGKEPQAVG